MNKIFLSADSFFEKAERRRGLFTISIFTGLFLLLLVSLVTKVNFETIYLGMGLTRLSLHPFDLENENDLRFRILSPLLAYLLFFRGVAFKYFMLIILAFFFGMNYFFQRRQNLKPSEAIGITALLVFSTLSFYQFYFPAYVDPLSFLLIILFMFNYKKPFLSTFLLLLMLFNHENTIFLFPFLFLLAADGNFKLKNLMMIASRFVAAIVPYLIFREIISLHSEVEYNASYYFDPNNMKWSREHVVPHLLPGIFQAFRLSWIFPLAAIAVDIYQKRYRELFLMIVALVFVLSQLIFAWDISRLVGMAFPVIILSALRMRSFLGTEKFLFLTYAVLLINFFIPAYCIGALDPISYAPFWLK